MAIIHVVLNAEGQVVGLIESSETRALRQVKSVYDAYALAKGVVGGNLKGYALGSAVASDLTERVQQSPFLTEQQKREYADRIHSALPVVDTLTIGHVGDVAPDGTVLRALVGDAPPLSAPRPPFVYFVDP